MRGARWLSTGWNGGYRDGDAAYNISVPDGWDRTDLTAYVRERIDEAGFTAGGPALGPRPHNPKKSKVFRQYLTGNVKLRWHGS